MMKKKTIIFFITAISLSLIGLVSIQLYWIKNAISVKEANFSRGVSEAVSSAIYKYNKIELASRFYNKNHQHHHFNKVFNVLDSINRLYYREIFHPDKKDENNPTNKHHSFLQKRISLDINASQNLNQTFTFDTSLVRKSETLPNRNNGYVQRNINPAYQDASFYLFRERTKIINDLFDDLIFNQYSSSLLPGEVRKKALDSLLNFELQNQGINTSYEFGIYNPKLNSLIDEKSGYFSEDLLKKGYVYSLFPNDIFKTPEYLLVYFPNQKNYVMSQLNLMLGISSVFIFAIIFSFVFVIFTIIRQKKLSAMKNDFINNMTHELKTPISTISLACQALNDKDIQKTEKLYQSYITMINEENKRLSTMTQKVLQTALIDRGKLRLNITGLDVHDLINNAIEKISLQLKNNHGKITTNFEAEYTYIEADKVHIGNVLFNLLDNAMKYTYKSPEITVSTYNKENGISISIQDNGVGISKVNQKKIFENLYRISTGNVHDVKGFGLGLSYVKKVVDLHQGDIKVESELKKGSKFTIFLPFGFNKEKNNN